MTREAAMGMNVREAMTGRPSSAAPDTPLSQVAELMETQDIGAIPVLDGDQLVGMITDRDIVVRAVAKAKNPLGMASREVSSGELVTVRPDQDLSDALHLMAQHQVRRLPVVDDENRLVGVVSQADIALDAQDKSVGQMVAGISKPAQRPRQL
jgi:CBS domain-containing protein